MLQRSSSKLDFSEINLVVEDENEDDEEKNVEDENEEVFL